MAWPKFNRKPPAQAVTMAEGRGDAPSGAGASPVRHVTPSGPQATPASPDATPSSGPVPWPGVALPAQRGELPETGEEPGNEGDVPFWDWAPSEDAEDTRFPVDDDGGTVRGRMTLGQAYAERAVVTPVETPVESTDAGPRREGIGHRFTRLDHIFGDTRMGAWRRRAVIAIVVGLVVTIVLDWRIGLTAAVIVAIADTIYRSRSVTPPQPGIKMTRAQKRTLRQLAKLERAGYRALHSRLIPDSDDHIDHLVVGPAGVFSIDSEAWEKKLPVRTKNARQLWHGPFSKKDRLEHARWEAEQAAEVMTRFASQQLLEGLPAGTVSVRPAMAVYGPKIPWDVATIRDVDVFSGGRLRTYLRRYARQNHTRPLSQAQVEQIYRAAQGAFPNHDRGVPAATRSAS